SVFLGRGNGTFQSADNFAVASDPHFQVATVPFVTGADYPGGTFTLTFNGQTTTPIDVYNASAQTVQSALEALSTVGSGNVTVGSYFSRSWNVLFCGALAEADVPLLTADSSGLNSPYEVLVTSRPAVMPSGGT